jgi:callose synthase
MSFARKLRYVLKLVSAAAWVVILPVTYAYSGGSPSGLARIIKGWLGNGQNQPSLYNLAVLIYLAPNMLAAMLFIFPFIRRPLEISNLKVVTFMMWWSQVISRLLFCVINYMAVFVDTFIQIYLQPRLFVGRGMHEGAFSLLKYVKSRNTDTRLTHLHS